MFGNSSTTGGSTSLFGNSNTTGSTFGTPSNTSGSLFGGGSTTNTSGSLFGNTGTTTNNTTSGSMFGSGTPTTGNQSGSLFGGTSNTGNNQSGSLFGGTSNTGNNPSGSLFGGSSNTGNQSSSLFGGGTSNNNNGTGSLFGGTSTVNNTSGSLFGGASSFSSTAQPSSTGSLFGNTQTPGQQAGSLFGSGATGNTSFSNNSQQQTVQHNSQAGPWWLRELQAIEAAYQPGPDSKFSAMLYEVVGVAPDLLCVPGAVAPAHLDFVKSQRKREVLSSRPWINQREWQKAEEVNPDPANWMPFALDGVKALKERVQAQAMNVQEQLALLHYSGAEEEKNSTDSSAQKQRVWLDNVDTGHNFDSMIDQCKHEHIRLILRLIKVMGRLERLQCIKSRGGRMQPEIDFSNRIAQLQKLLSDPRGCKAQLAQLAAQVQVSDSQTHNLVGTGDDRPLAGENAEKAMFDFLELQREGLEHLMKIVKLDSRDMKLMKNRLRPHLK